MKTKTLYIIVFILIAIVLIAIIYDKKKIPDVNLPVVKVNSEVAAPLEVATVNTQIVPYNQAITVISAPQKKEQVIPKVDNAQNTQSSTVSSKQDSSLANASASNKDVQAAPAGVTILGKYPTKEETKEMNAKGIVIY